MLNIAVRAARRAGDLIVRQLDRADSLSVTDKGRNDFVTEVDRQAEAAIIDTLLTAYPAHAILAEESGARAGNEYEWIIDPLDGTTNFLHGFPQFAVSIALRHRGRLEQAVVYDPIAQELYTASRGAGAQLNNRRMRVSRQAALERALIGTGFPFRDLEHLDDYLAQFRAVVLASAGVRRAGAAALDLAYVAAGRLDAFWEQGLAIWDIAAGALLIEEAGGLVGDLDGGARHLETGAIVAGNPGVFKQLTRVLMGAGRPPA